MDTSQMQDQVTQWIQTQFADQQTISKNDLVTRAQQSNLPQEAKSGLQMLPDGQFQKQDLIDKVQSMGGQAAGMMGGMGGRLGGG